MKNLQYTFSKPERICKERIKHMGRTQEHYLLYAILGGMVVWIVVLSEMIKNIRRHPIAVGNCLESGDIELAKTWLKTTLDYIDAYKLKKGAKWERKLSKRTPTGQRRCIKIQETQR